MSLAFILSILLHIFTIPARKILYKVNQLYNFDQVKDQFNTLPPIHYNSLPQFCSKWNINWQYLFPTLYLSAAVIDSGLIMAKNNFKYTYTGLPQLYEHKIFPKDFWIHSDILMYFIYVHALGIHGNLIGDTQMLNGKFLIFQIWDTKSERMKMFQNGKVLEPKLAEAIFKFRCIALKMLRFVMFSAWMEMNMDFQFALWGNWTNSIRDYIFAAYCPVFFFYAANVNLFMILYFALSTRYIGYKQKFLQLKLTRLQAKQHFQIFKYGAVKRVLWQQFLTTFNIEYYNLHKEIKALNGFWSKYLAIYFVVYIIHSTYLIYALLFEPSDLGFFGRKFFFFFGTHLATVLLLINYLCSDVVAKNLALFRERRVFYLTFMQWSFGVKLDDLLKINEMEASSRAIAKMGFSLLDVIRVNSRIFEIIFYFVSVTFMLLFRNQYYK